MASNTTVGFSRRSLTLATPHRWKHQNLAGAVTVVLCNSAHKKHSGISSPVNFRQSLMKNEISARKLAAGLWKLRFVEVSGGGDAGAYTKDGSFPSSKSKLVNGNHHDQDSEERFKGTRDEQIPKRPVTILRTRKGLLCELEASITCIKSPKEEATKWNPNSTEATNEFTRVHRRKLLEDRKLVGEDDSVATDLLEELLQAKNSINKLKAAQKSSKRKARQLLQIFEKEKVLWKRRQHRKIEAMLDKLKDKLSRERRRRERMEKVNEKLINELAAANESAKKLTTNYEKEKRERELTEEVFDELARQLGEEKAKVEMLMWEVEEEREMMRITDQLREERVYMKLSDAKDLVEEKYNQMVHLISHPLRSKGGEDSQLEEAIESVNIERIIDLFYDLSKSSNEELRIYNESYHTPIGPLSTTIHIENVDDEGLKLNKNYVSDQSSGLGQITNSPEFCHEQDEFSRGPQMGARDRDNVNQLRSCPNDETTFISDTSYSQYRFIQGEGWKKLKEAKNSIEGGAGTSNSTTNNMNPHITRGMRGCIEWPREITKPNSKAISLQEKVKSQKSQLQHILKPKPC